MQRLSFRRAPSPLHNWMDDVFDIPAEMRGLDDFSEPMKLSSLDAQQLGYDLGLGRLEDDARDALEGTLDRIKQNQDDSDELLDSHETTLDITLGANMSQNSIRTSPLLTHATTTQRNPVMLVPADLPQSEQPLRFGSWLAGEYAIVDNDAPPLMDRSGKVVSGAAEDGSFDGGDVESIRGFGPVTDSTMAKSIASSEASVLTTGSEATCECEVAATLAASPEQPPVPMNERESQVLPGIESLDCETLPDLVEESDESAATTLLATPPSAPRVAAGAHFSPLLDGWKNGPGNVCTMLSREIPQIDLPSPPPTPPTTAAGTEESQQYTDAGWTEVGVSPLEHASPPVHLTSTTTTVAPGVGARTDTLLSTAVPDATSLPGDALSFEPPSPPTMDSSLTGEPDHLAFDPVLITPNDHDSLPDDRDSRHRVSPDVQLAHSPSTVSNLKRVGKKNIPAPIVIGSGPRSLPSLPIRSGQIANTSSVDSSTSARRDISSRSRPSPALRSLGRQALKEKKFVPPARVVGSSTTTPTCIPSRSIGSADLTIEAPVRGREDLSSEHIGKLIKTCDDYTRIPHWAPLARSKATSPVAQPREALSCFSTSVSLQPRHVEHPLPIRRPSIPIDALLNRDQSFDVCTPPSTSDKERDHASTVGPNPPSQDPLDMLAYACRVSAGEESWRGQLKHLAVRDLDPGMEACRGTRYSAMEAEIYDREQGSESAPRSSHLQADGRLESAHWRFGAEGLANEIPDLRWPSQFPPAPMLASGRADHVVFDLSDSDTSEDIPLAKKRRNSDRTQGSWPQPLSQLRCEVSEGPGPTAVSYVDAAGKGLMAGSSPTKRRKSASTRRKQDLVCRKTDPEIGTQAGNSITKDNQDGAVTLLICNAEAEDDHKQNAINKEAAHAEITVNGATKAQVPEDNKKEDDHEADSSLGSMKPSGRSSKTKSKAKRAKTARQIAEGARAIKNIQVHRDASVASDDQGAEREGDDLTRHQTHKTDASLDVDETDDMDKKTAKRVASARPPLVDKDSIGAAKTRSRKRERDETDEHVDPSYRPAQDKRKELPQKRHSLATRAQASDTTLAKTGVPRSKTIAASAPARMALSITPSPPAGAGAVITRKQTSTRTDEPAEDSDDPIALKAVDGSKTQTGTKIKSKAKTKDQSKDEVKTEPKIHQRAYTSAEDEILYKIWSSHYGQTGKLMYEAGIVALRQGNRPLRSIDALKFRYGQKRAEFGARHRKALKEKL